MASRAASCDALVELATLLHFVVVYDREVWAAGAFIAAIQVDTTACKCTATLHAIFALVGVPAGIQCPRPLVSVGAFALVAAFHVGARS